MALSSDSDLIDHYINNRDWRIKENSNMSFSLQGLNNYLSTTLVAGYWLSKVYPENIRRMHLSGDFHIHNLGFLGAYCVGWDLSDLLLTGFTGASGKAESKPARHLRTALLQIVNFFYTLQGESAGAQAFSNFDTFLAPFIRMDKLSRTDVFQALQEFLFNINVPTRVGFQTPFTNLTLDLEIPKFMSDEPAIIGGTSHSFSYGDVQAEEDLFNETFADVMSQGDAKGRIFSFPIPTYNITENFRWDHSVTRHIFEMTSKFGIPYFANFVNSDMEPSDVRSMCCRLQVDNRHLRRKGGGFFGANPLTGSIGVVTINLARIGYETKDESLFLEHLGRVMEIAKRSLEIKRAILDKLIDQGLYPYSKFYLRSIKLMTGSHWKNHFSTIGLIGMNEALLNCIGDGIATDNGLGFAIKVLMFMRKEIEKYQEETGNLYNLEATPAEGSSHSLAKKDLKLHPDIKVANMSAVKFGSAPFYTNSTSLPVDFQCDIFEALDHQAQLQKLYTGGTVFHIYLGERLFDWRTAAQLIRKITSSFRLPYITFTPTFSLCPSHGYLNGEQLTCPQCGNKCEVYSRVVGYFRPIDQWNEGKRAEFSVRHTFDLPDKVPLVT